MYYCIPKNPDDVFGPSIIHHKAVPAFSIASTTVTRPIYPRPFLPVPVARGTPGQTMVKCKCNAVAFFLWISWIYMNKRNGECFSSTGAAADQKLNNNDHSCSKTGCCENFKSTSVSKTKLKRKLLDGATIAPVLLTLPIYTMAFGVFGHTQPWKFSKWIYNLTNPSENFLHDHF